MRKELHYCTKKRKHSFHILKALLFFRPTLETKMRKEQYKRHNVKKKRRGNEIVLHTRQVNDFSNEPNKLMLAYEMILIRDV